MNKHLRIFAGFYSGTWRVFAGDREMQHMHKHPFPSEKRAWKFVDRIKDALENDFDLNLAHWEAS